VAPITGALSLRQEAERIAALKIERPLTHAESVEMAKRSMRWLFRQG
jgi:hypothetical protein